MQKGIIFALILIIAAAASLHLLRATSPIFNFIFEPKDLYSALYEKEFKLQLGEYHEINFKAKYPGNHAISIVTSEATPIGQKYESDYLIEITIYNEKNRPILNKSVSEPVYTFWPGGKSGEIAILTFRVPEEVPRGEQMHASIKVKKGDRAFQHKHGPLHLVLRKFSDE